MLISDICAGDKDKEVKVEFFKSQKSGKHQNLGQTLFTVNEIQQDKNIELSLTK